MEKKLLWVDDVRPVPNKFKQYIIYIATSYEEAIQHLNNNTFDVICLDHDLGEDKSGYDICKYIVENKITCKVIRIHSMNPVGRQNMVQLLERYTNIPII